MPSPRLKQSQNWRAGINSRYKVKTSIFPPVKCTKAPHRQGSVWKTKILSSGGGRKDGVVRVGECSSRRRKSLKERSNSLGQCSSDTRWADVSYSGFPGVGTWATEEKFDSVYVFFPSSLNREKRKQEQQRATQGNPAILGRVTKPEPRCQAQRWHEDWQRAEKHTANVARHPCGQCKSQSQKVAPISSSFLPGYFWMGSVRRVRLAVLLLKRVTAAPPAASHLHSPFYQTNPRVVFRLY